MLTQFKQVRPTESFDIQDGVSSICLQTDPVGRKVLNGDAARHHGHLHCQISQKSMAEVTSWPSWLALHRQSTRFERKANLGNFHEMGSTIWWVGLS